MADTVATMMVSCRSRIAFDDEVESISIFDPLTGEVIKRVSRITVYPKSHYVTPREVVLKAVDMIKEELDERLKELKEQNKLVEAQRLEQRTRFDIEMLPGENPFRCGCTAAPPDGAADHADRCCRHAPGAIPSRGSWPDHPDHKWLIPWPR